MTDITLKQATQIIDACLAEARRQGFAPMTVAVLDRGGHLVALQREDNSSNMRAEIAAAKARGSLGFGASTRALMERAAQVPQFFTAMAALSGGNVVPIPGGLLIRDADKLVLGAVGLSGDTGDNDEKCAIAALAALSWLS
jgi:uncharacterized protein GlcG (DUF336 family)